jgi:hypothetical protein
MLPHCEQPTPALATYTTPDFLPGSSCTQEEKDAGAVCGSLDEEKGWGMARALPGSCAKIEEEETVQPFYPFEDPYEEDLEFERAFSASPELQIGSISANTDLALLQLQQSARLDLISPPPDTAHLHNAEVARGALRGRHNNFVSMRGAVLALDPPVNQTSVSHPSTEDTGVLSAVTALPRMQRSTFSLRDELMHVFVSYRVSTEGGAGNRMAGQIAEKIRSLSTDSRQELQIPQHGRGLWPKGIKHPVPFRLEEAKVHCPSSTPAGGLSATHHIFSTSPVIFA